MTTPYGTSTFVTNPPTSGSTQYVEATDPLSRKERAEYRNSYSTILPSSDPAGELPDSAKIQCNNQYLYYGNTLYWDKKTFAHHPPDQTTGTNYDKATRYKWMWYGGITTGAISSLKRPYENRVWYEYPGQGVGYGTTLAGSEQPAKIGRRTSPNDTQVDSYQHNELGQVTQHTDSLGRVRTYQYATNNIDLLTVKQKNGAGWDTLATFTYDPADPPRLPRTTMDASGQTTTFAWNTRGQIISFTQPGGLVTNWSYDSTGYLSSVDGPLPGTADAVSYTYDAFGRTRTTTSPGEHTITVDYDSLDRPTLVTHPDGSTEQFSYQRPGGVKILDATHYKDRENRWTLMGYNALREKTVEIDPLNRVTQYNWCYCGALQDLFDAEGKRTHWDYDIGGRLLKKTYADGTQHTHTYDVAGRPATTTDAKGQVKTYSYHLDGQVAGVTYSNSQIATPNVTLSYDSIYGRLSQMTDGTSTTSYMYHPVDGATPGAGNLATIDGPLTADTISHTYDALGRLKTRSINGAANTTTIDFYDARGRVTQLTNPLGTFTHTYDPANLQLAGITAPNGLSTTFSYENAAGDFRLAGISAAVNGTPISAHAYTYSPAGNIKTWSQAIDANPAKTWQIDYDRADQLEAATLKNPASGVLEQHAWRYDKSGNRTSRQNGPQITRGTFNAVNQIVSEQPGGWMRVRGTTDEPATVRVKANAANFSAAATNAGNEFSGWVETVPGANTITIEATDTSPNANVRTNQYTVNIAGTNRTPAYDANGNMTANGSGQTYAWDAENRLAKITYADASCTEFSYDGFSRRTRITEKDNAGAMISDHRYVWAGGNQPAEERDASGNSVEKRYFPEGEHHGSQNYYYTKDHLGSVREITDARGNLTARYAYDMWGKRVKLSGTIDSPVGYTGHHHHERSGLILTWFRAYDAESGVWISRDPIEEEGGVNLYGYVENNPLNLVDLMGNTPMATDFPFSNQGFEGLFPEFSK